MLDSGLIDEAEYKEIKARQEVLDEFVKNLNTIQLQDSLLKLSSMDSVALRQMVLPQPRAARLLLGGGGGRAREGREREGEEPCAEPSRACGGGLHQGENSGSGRG